MSMSTDDPQPYVSATLRGISARGISAHTGVGCSRLTVSGVSLQFDLDTPAARARALAALARLKAVVGQLERHATADEPVELDALAAPAPAPAPAPEPEPVPEPVARTSGGPYPQAPHITGEFPLPGGAGPARLPDGVRAVEQADPQPAVAAFDPAVPMPLPAGLLCP
jgi:hypothetical protein